VFSTNGPKLRQENMAESALVEIVKGGIVFNQGDPAVHWFEVLSGTVRTCRFYIDGHRQLTGFFFAGDVFGVEPERYGATAEAVTDAVLRRSAVQKEGQPVGGDVRSSALERALGSAQSCIFLLGHRTANERLAAFLLVIARRPGARLRFELPMSRADIADHLGLTIHTVSRTFSDLIRRQVIALEGRQFVRVLDLAQLEWLAGEADEGLANPAKAFSLA
jgi:CRP/FNR family transcriptional regulator, nitrogen fixation regulation protein